MAKAKAKVNTVPSEVTLVLTWEEFKAVATMVGAITPTDLKKQSTEMLDSAERYGDLLRPRSDVEVDDIPIKTLHGIWKTIAPIYLGGGY